mmetsp:Transcript_7531/g.9579  ORF Transcript_7531/g.9579 Transcript_7531/m.9579 type:complete len:124 (-) Transcript_7531:837-1208(-)|eukprot:CAMPEP_0204844812 /NCGR_PEP_ID=MMETSP1347-20130617/602_1 /ASSEMBLY_ACC=CAM_ASM_000690 /TAXON_ID=215587 /ORGANISM="Aplanochytrium stocchinoi, Strain GSBS06" /LENGTH=123 /DNA_ID=CAMNT_0051984493 /DNA_START=305 /DNA_END=676 /DNA_ORIENTATION=+
MMAEVSRKRLRFRNYVPQSIELQEFIISSRPVEEAGAIIKRVLEDSARLVAEFQERGEIVNLVPEKINYDLKRNIRKKLKSLENRTKRAILKLRSENESESESESGSSSGSGSESEDSGSGSD